MSPDANCENCDGRGCMGCVFREFDHECADDCPLCCQPFEIEGWQPLQPRHPASERFHTILREMGELHDRKQRDYGRDDDPFANVRASTEWGMPAWVGAMVRATDKVRRLQTLADKGELANESAIDAFNDLAVYAVIARVLYEQDAFTPDKTEQVGSGDHLTHEEWREARGYVDEPGITVDWSHLEPAEVGVDHYLYQEPADPSPDHFDCDCGCAMNGDTCGCGLHY